MNRPREAFLKWPGWTHLRFALLVSAAGTLWFLLIYGGCDFLTARRQARMHIHFGWELQLPFVPEAVLLYLSMYLLLAGAPFILRQRSEFLALALTLNALILAAGISFLIFPAELAFPPPRHLGLFPGLFHFADQLNLTYNLLPSLHVALSGCCVAVYARRVAWPGKLALWSWALAIAISTLLTYQHHVLDVVSGGALAWIGARCVPQQLAS
jgi:membrane-associated phospholipid phosphatase